MSVAASRRTCAVAPVVVTVIQLAATRMPLLLPATAWLPLALLRRDCCVRYIAAAPQAVYLVRGGVCCRPERPVGLRLATHLPENTRFNDTVVGCVSVSASDERRHMQLSFGAWLACLLPPVTQD